MDGATLLSFDGRAPLVDPAAFVAPGARLIGDVAVGPGSSIWYNCVLRGDVNRIRIGARSNVQDGSVIHVESPHPGAEAGHATIIGDEVLIGHLAMIHGCRLHDRAFVGLGAIVMNDCEIEGDAMLAAGAMLTPGKRIGARQMWAGRPAKYVRDLRPDELAYNNAAGAGYAELAKLHRQSQG